MRGKSREDETGGEGRGWGRGGQRRLAAVGDVMVSVIVHDEALDVAQLAMQVVHSLLALQELAVVLLLLVLLQHLCAQFLQHHHRPCC